MAFKRYVFLSLMAAMLAAFSKVQAQEFESTGNPQTDQLIYQALNRIRNFPKEFTDLVPSDFSIYGKSWQVVQPEKAKLELRLGANLTNHISNEVDLLESTLKIHVVAFNLKNEAGLQLQKSASNAMDDAGKVWFDAHPPVSKPGEGEKLMTAAEMGLYKNSKAYFQKITILSTNTNVAPDKVIFECLLILPLERGYLVAEISKLPRSRELAEKWFGEIAEKAVLIKFGKYF